MKPERFATSELNVKQGQELILSGESLLDLMQAVLAKDLPFRFRASGWSMVPFIKNGDVITVAPVQKQCPKLGDVVAFIHPENNKLVVHRVVAINGDAYFIQGDSDQNLLDGFVPTESLVGRVTKLWRDGKPVRLGLGPERVVIAYLSRWGLLKLTRAKLASLRKLFLQDRN